MNKSEMIAAVAAQTGLSRQKVGDVLEALLTEMTGALQKGEKVQFSGFGTFEVKKTAAKVARNPRTGEPVAVAEQNRPVFSAGKLWKENFNDET